MCVNPTYVGGDVQKDIWVYFRKIITFLNV